MRSSPSAIVILALVLVGLIPVAHAGRAITASSGALGEGGIPVFLNVLRQCSPGDFNNPLAADRCAGFFPVGFDANRANMLAASLGWQSSPSMSYLAIRESFTAPLPNSTEFSYRYTNQPSGGSLTSYLNPSVSDGNWIVALSGAYGPTGARNDWSGYYVYRDLIFSGTLGFTLQIGSPYNVVTEQLLPAGSNCPKSNPPFISVVCSLSPDGTTAFTTTTNINMIEGLTVDQVNVLKYSVPEPGTWTLGLIALLGGAFVMRRRKAEGNS